MECVILARPGESEGPPDLVELLRKRNVRIRTFPGAYAAMAHLLRLDAAQRDSGRRAPLALVVIDPSANHRAADLVQAIARFVPHVVCWRYDSDASPRLRGYVLEPQETNSSPVKIALDTNGPGVGRSDHGQSPPRLRLTGDYDAPASPPRADSPAEDDPSGRDAPGPPSDEAETDAPSSASILSEEELSMLLSDDPDEIGRRRKKR